MGIWPVSNSHLFLVVNQRPTGREETQEGHREKRGRERLRLKDKQRDMRHRDTQRDTQRWRDKRDRREK